MREIKFRAWDKETKYMFDVLRWNKDRKGNTVCIQGESSTNIRIATTKEYIDKICIMQYTGLLDKNGKEIYEGDIITSNLKIPHEVKDLISFWSYDIPDEQRYTKSPYDIEVLGNIYENPELLNKEA